MKFEEHEIEKIANLVVQQLKPMLDVKQSSADDLLNIEEAAVLLNKSKEQIYQWVNKSAHKLSDFPFMKLGKSLRFSKNELLEWMKRKGKSLESNTRKNQQQI